MTHGLTQKKSTLTPFRELKVVAAAVDYDCDEPSWKKWQELQQETDRAKRRVAGLEDKLSRGKSTLSEAEAQILNSRLIEAKSKCISLEAKLDQAVQVIYNMEYIGDTTQHSNKQQESAKEDAAQPPSEKVCRCQTSTRHSPDAFIFFLGFVVMVSSIIVFAIWNAARQLSPPPPKVISAQPADSGDPTDALFLSDGQINIAAAFVTRGDGTAYDLDNYELTRQVLVRQDKDINSRYLKFNTDKISSLDQLLEDADGIMYGGSPSSAGRAGTAECLEQWARKQNSCIVKLDRLEGKVPCQQP